MRRSLKAWRPGNLLLDSDGRCWGTEFGLAHIEADATLTRTGDLLGTLRYMSPEQVRGERGLVDSRSDIYGLGITPYELLTLKPAFTGDERMRQNSGLNWIWDTSYHEARPPASQTVIAVCSPAE